MKYKNTTHEIGPSQLLASVNSVSVPSLLPPYVTQDEHLKPGPIE